MEDIKDLKEKLNNISDLPEVPRKEDGKIDVEKIAVGKDAKGFIIPDKIFDAYLKELPPGTTNESQSYRAYNGGKLARLENDPEEATRRGKVGGPASQDTQKTRRSIRDILEEISKKAANAEDIERLGLEDGTTTLEAANFAAIQKAIRGDIKALEYIRDTLGEKPAETLNASVTQITPEDKELLQNVNARLKAEQDYN